MKNSILLLTSMLLLFTSFHFKENPNLQKSKAIAAISTDKMNVFYIGVNNPISVAISGVPIEATKVSMDKGTITPTAQLGQYNVRVFEVGKVMVYLEGKDRQGKMVKSSSEFRVKNVLIPTARLGNKSNGVMGVGEMKAQRGIIAPILNYDISARLNVLRFKLTYVAKSVGLCFDIAGEIGL